MDSDGRTCARNVCCGCGCLLVLEDNDCTPYKSKVGTQFWRPRRMGMTGVAIRENQVGRVMVSQGRQGDCNT